MLYIYLNLFFSLVVIWEISIPLLQPYRLPRLHPTIHYPTANISPNIIRFQGFQVVIISLIFAAFIFFLALGGFRTMLNFVYEEERREG